MPALFCFKRSKSEIVMSQSPPSALYRAGEEGEAGRSQTLPRRAHAHAWAPPDPRASPSPSAKSLNVEPPPDRLADPPDDPDPPIHYLVAVHRKQCRSEAFFLPWQRVRPALFGVPLVVAVGGAGQGAGSGRRLYERVWAQLARLLSPRPPHTDTPNHAADCDDSLGYEFPFTLRAVSGGGGGGGGVGAWCASCPWPALCRGCPIPCDEGPPLRGLRRRGLLLAIDWEPTALHLRYQGTRERMCAAHPSAARCGAGAARPVDLASCLAAFTSEERLEQRYHCDGCRSAQPATKKLQIWRAPPVLIIHLKRFQYVNNKWIKSQKVVNFPFEDFDPTPYLASVPQETILRHRELSGMRRRSAQERRISESDSDDQSDDQSNDHQDDHHDDDQHDSPPRSKRRSINLRARARLESTSLTATPVNDDNLVDYHQHHLEEDQDPFDLKYKLYAVVSHSGQLHGGHYVAYAHNAAGGWLCYNDSSCREVGARGVEPANAYLLFYERRGLRYERYLPPHAPHPPPQPRAPAPDDADLRALCSLM